jgi:hypothetical protein
MPWQQQNILTFVIDQWALACVDSRANFLGDGRYGKQIWPGEYYMFICCITFFSLEYLVS